MRTEAVKNKNARKNKNNEISLGKWAVAIGYALCAIRLFGLSLGAVLFSAKWLYVIILCLLCGGFAVLAYEKKGKASAYSLGAMAFYLISTVLGNMSGGSGALLVVSNIFLVLSFFFSALVLFISAGTSLVKRLGAVLVLIIAAVSFVNSLGADMPTVVSLILLLMKYLVAAFMYLSI